ncbi:glycine betaine ABC transporter substrate-binding protein [Agrococcus jejuensis]|uniref:Osmoprotectant transport system substrate-binding protein n=1 Tax=Agrococcus jejuensis TaxID=399736 RepID=A0A1G8A6K5_9MICO|nr:ABC transporter substrate-binding protein [Agrococcus jejuensis]SDH16487.1 osmoprotectant transport system substrate-binding protein [Agrococcus jejuensis]
MQRPLRAIALSLVAGVALAGCATSDPTDNSGGGEPAGDGQIVVGSNAFPEAEILAEIYAQALEDAGYEVERNLSIGTRQQTFAALEDGGITLQPEYAGNLLTYLDEDATETSEDEIADALDAALEGTGIQAYDFAPAQDQDAYVVTSEYAEANGLESIADLEGVQPFTLGANPEFAELSYGLPGLADAYGISDVEFSQYTDFGGPDTVQALLDGTIDVADIYTTSPAIAENDLVVLEDPEQIIAAQNIVPVIADSVATDEIAEILNAVSAALTTEDLIALRTRVEGSEAASPAVAAADWLVEQGLIEG